MTGNQISYWNLKELERSNLAKEAETNRANLAKETETNRSNLASEEEKKRHNIVSEITGGVSAIGGLFRNSRKVSNKLFR